MRRGPARLLSLPILLVLVLPLFAQPTSVRAAGGARALATPVAPATSLVSRPRLPAADSNAVAATSASTSQPVGTEVVALRTATSRTYVDKHGLRAVLSPGPVNYQDRAGNFQPIDDHLVAAVGGGYRNAANAFALTLPADLGAGPVAVGTAAGTVGFQLVGAKGAASVSGATATYANALPGVTVADAATNRGLKETLTLASPAAPASYAFALTLPAGVAARATAGGGIVLVNAAGSAVAAFVAPTIHDAKGATGTATLTLAAGTLTLAADPAWLAAPARAYPVTIDPSLVTLAGAAQDCSLDSGSPAGSFCSDDDEVGVDNSTQRQLLQFNLSSIAGPADVLSAQLTLQETSSQASSPVNVELHPLTDSWTTGATWNTRDGSAAWTMPGGDVAASPTWTTAVGPATGSYSWWLTALVNAWANGTMPNDGLLLKAASETPGSFLTFASSRDPNQANWPTLAVTYEPQVGERGFSPLLGFGLTDRMGLEVNAANGNLVLHAHDVGIAGTGLPLVVDRLFNNLAGDVGDTNELGPGWIHTTGSDLWLDPGVAGDGVIYHGVGGYALFYLRNADGSYQTPPGEDATLVKHGDGSFTLTWHASGERFQFDTYGNLTSDVDRNGNALSFTYNGREHNGTHTITDSQGRVLTFSYTNTSFPSDVTQIADWTGRTWQYGYDAAGELTTYTDPANQVTRYAYSNGDLTQITDLLGNITTLTYQQTNPERVLSITFGAGTSVAATYQFTYNTGNTVVTDPNTHQTTYSYDGQGRQTKVVDALSNTFQWAWTSDNHVQTYMDAKHQQFVSTYDDAANPPLCSTQVGTHNLCSASLPTGATTRWSYSDSSHPYYPTGATDPQGNQVTSHYTPAGNPDTITDQLPSQNQTQVFYNPNGTVDHLIDARGNQTSYTYDAHGNLTQVTPPSYTPGTGSSQLGPTKVTPDLLSRTSSVTDGKGQQRVYAYDTLDRVTAITYPGYSTGNVSFVPDPAGNLTSMTDSTGGTAYAYDARNRQTQKTLPASLGGGSMTYGYDGVNNLTSFTDAASVPGQRLTVSYGYNPADLLTSLAENGKTTSFGSDPNHRRTSTTYPDGVVLSQVYDTAGRLSSIAGMNGATTLTSFAYGYTKSGADTMLPSTVTETLTSAAPNSVVTHATVANGYDQLNRLTKWLVTNRDTNAILHSYTYQFDGAGNRTQVIADPKNGTGQIVSDPSQGVLHSNENDLTFNAASEIDHIVAYGAAGTNPATSPYSYDPAGNQTGNDTVGSSQAGLRIGYAGNNQTQSVTNDPTHGYVPVAMTFSGPGQDERVKRQWTVNGTSYTSSYTYSQLGLSGYTSNGIGTPGATTSVTSWIVRDPFGTPIAQRYSNGSEYSYLFNGMGDVVALEDPGTIQSAYDFCPTGNEADLGGTTPMTTVGLANPLRQGGMAYDDIRLYVAGGCTPVPVILKAFCDLGAGIFCSQGEGGGNFRNFTRSLEPADLGLTGDQVTELSGTLSVSGSVVTVRINMIDAVILNPFGVITSRMNTARSEGGRALRIESCLANP